MMSKGLSTDEVHQLAHAIDTGGPVVIGYESGSGARTRRMISMAQLVGTTLVAWCHLRNDERYFSVQGVLFVSTSL